MKKIEPGMPCIIKGSAYNDGRIVTPIKFKGVMMWVNPEGQQFLEPGWEVAEALVKKAGNVPSTINAYLCEERVMFPLDNPGDDEEDTFSKIREQVPGRQLSEVE